MERHFRQIRSQVGILAIGLAFGACLPAETYQILPAPDTNFTLKVYKTGLLSGKVHIFEFERYAGESEYAEGRPEDWELNFTVESDSLLLKDEWVSKKDFPKVIKEARLKILDVENHPTMKFVSCSVSSTSDGKYDVLGDLTIRGISRPSTVQIRVAGAACILQVDGSSVVN